MGRMTSAAQISSFKRVAGSFAFFLAHYVYTADKGGVKFDPWEWQDGLAHLFQFRKRLVILKARQIGLSWLAAAYAVWVAITRRGASVLLVSQTEKDARLLLERVKFIFDNLPEWMKPDVTERNQSTLRFGGLQSVIYALPSTEKAGRGITATLVVCDEHAFHQWAMQNMTALGPTMDAGGQMICLSTANGIGNLFFTLWGKAGDAASQWTRVFLGYDRHPDRDAAWYAAQQGNYTQPWMIHQEYPRDPEEAFVQTGRPRFDRVYLDKHRAMCVDPLPAEKWPRHLAGWSSQDLRVFDVPKAGHRYFAGADVAEGLEHGDYSDLSVFGMDAEGGRPKEVLSLHGHWEPDEFGRKIDVIARLYPGVYGIERNNHGYAVIVTTRSLGTPGIWREMPVLTNLGQEIEAGKEGWETTKTTKPLMIDEMAAALRGFEVVLQDELAIPELIFYQTLPDGKTSAPEGQWDDRVMSRAIAIQMKKYLAAPVTVDGSKRRTGTFAAKEW